MLQSETMPRTTRQDFNDLALRLELELLLGDHTGFRRRLRRALQQASLQNSAERVSKRHRQLTGFVS
jgi:hypothetical protein